MILNPWCRISDLSNRCSVVQQLKQQSQLDKGDLNNADPPPFFLVETQGCLSPFLSLS